MTRQDHICGAALGQRTPILSGSAWSCAEHSPAHVWAVPKVCPLSCHLRQGYVYPLWKAGTINPSAPMQYPCCHIPTVGVHSICGHTSPPQIIIRQEVVGGSLEEDPSYGAGQRVPVLFRAVVCSQCMKSTLLWMISRRRCAVNAVGEVALGIYIMVCKVLCMCLELVMSPFQVPFTVLQGEGVEYLGHANDAVIAISNYRLHIKFKDSVINVSLDLPVPAARIVISRSILGRGEWEHKPFLWSVAGELCLLKDAKPDAVSTYCWSCSCCFAPALWCVDGVLFWIVRSFLCCSL